MDSDSVDAKVWPELDVAKGRDYDMTMWGWSAPVMLDTTSVSDILDSDTRLGRLNITGTRDGEIDRLAAELRGHRPWTSAMRCSAGCRRRSPFQGSTVDHCQPPGMRAGPRSARSESAAQGTKVPFCNDNLASYGG